MGDRELTISRMHKRLSSTQVQAHVWWGPAVVNETDGGGRRHFIVNNVDYTCVYQHVKELVLRRGARTSARESAIAVMPYRKPT